MNEPDYTQLSDQVSKQINDSLGGTIQYIIVASLVVTVAILALWIINSVRKWRTQKAILQIQKDIHEMNERQKGSPAIKVDETKPQV